MESAYGWSRAGWGKLAEKETSLAGVLGRTLRVPDAWTAFADCYLDALDQIARTEAAEPASWPAYSYPDPDYRRRDRTCDLAEWHFLLLERLAGSEAENRLDRLAGHPALGGPELTFVQARLAQLRGNIDAARTLTQECLAELPGHDGFADFAVQIGADLPVGFQNSATGLDLGVYAAGWYSLMRPPRMARRLIRFWERSATGWSGRGGRSWRLRWGRRPL